MKKSYFIAGMVALLACLWLASGVLVAPTERGVAESASSEDEKVSESKADVMTVRVRDLLAEPVHNEVVVTGRTQASRKAELRAETAGQIVEILADKGQAVEKDSIILRIEKRDRKARFTEAKERVRQREIEYKAAKSLEGKGFNSRIRFSQAKADLEAARAALSIARIDLKNTEITAPFSGIVYDRAVDVGDYVAVGDIVYSLIDLNPLDIKGFITEKNIDDISVGSQASVTLINGMAVDGVVTYVAPAANEDTRTFEVEVSVENPDQMMIEGMTAEMRIKMPEHKAHKISPSILSLSDDGQVGVKIVDDRNMVQFMPVEILADKPDFMWILGLPPVVRVITVGQEFVIQGQKVQPVPADGDGLL